MPWLLPFHFLTAQVNGWEHLWTALDGAVGSHEGSVLNVSGSHGAGVAGFKAERESGLFSLQVRSHTWDHLVARFAPLASHVLAVIDVEGFEQEAIMGMRGLIARGLLVWMRVELWSMAKGVVKDAYPGLALLGKHGYRACIPVAAARNARATETLVELPMDASMGKPGPAADAVHRLARTTCMGAYSDAGYCHSDVDVYHPSVFKQRCARHE